MLGEIKEESLEIREGTTRYVNISCKSKETGGDFDFTGYTVQTFLSFGYKKQYANTLIVGSLLSYEIPATISVGATKGICETRIFKGSDVFEVLRINVEVNKSVKPDTAPAD